MREVASKRIDIKRENFKSACSTLLRCRGGAKSSLDFRRLSLRIIRAAANAIVADLYLTHLIINSIHKTQVDRFSSKKYPKLNSCLGN
jgi:hypothetical protein